MSSNLKFHFIAISIKQIRLHSTIIYPDIDIILYFIIIDVKWSFYNTKIILQNLPISTIIWPNIKKFLNIHTISISFKLLQQVFVQSRFDSSYKTFCMRIYITATKKLSLRRLKSIRKIRITKTVMNLIMKLYSYIDKF